MEYGLDKRSNALKTFNTTFIIIWLLIACFPFIWTFWGSFKVRADFFSRADWWYAISAFNTLLETGGQFTSKAYSEAWTEGEFWKASRNTIRTFISSFENLPLSLIHISEPTRPY